MKACICILLIFITAASAMGEVVTKTVIYNDNDVELEGYLAWDNSIVGKRPGVMVVHQWTGLNDYIKMRCRKLAEMGYVAFAADIYGKGIRPQTTEEAAKQASIYRQDRQLMRQRANVGLQFLKKNELCDNNRVVAIGYCFGGGVVLELARSGASLAGVVSFHGNLDTPNPTDANKIACKILICHGANDPHVTMEQVNAFFNEMRAAKVDFQFIAYSGAVHAFTDPGAGNDPSQGVAYNHEADIRSWDHMKLFFAELFR